MPPPGTTQCRWGWNWSCWPRVCSTPRKPISAPRRWGSAAISRRAREAARKRIVVEGTPVLQGEGGDLAREGEDEMEVGAVEQFAAALGDPGCGRSGSRGGGARIGRTARSGRRGRRCGTNGIHLADFGVHLRRNGAIRRSRSGFSRRQAEVGAGTVLRDLHLLAGLCETRA